jgi:hypothetical protein
MKQEECCFIYDKGQVALQRGGLTKGDLKALLQTYSCTAPAVWSLCGPNPYEYTTTCDAHKSALTEPGDTATRL